MEVIEEVPVRSANHGKRWTKEEDAKMQELLRAGTLESAASALDRSKEAVWMRLLGSVALHGCADLAEKYEVTAEHVAEFHAAQEQRKAARVAQQAERKAAREAENAARQAERDAQNATRKAKLAEDRARKREEKQEMRENRRRAPRHQNAETVNSIAAANDLIRTAAQHLLEASKILLALQHAQ